jgi:hypothetical protein
MVPYALKLAIAACLIVPSFCRAQLAGGRVTIYPQPKGFWLAPSNHGKTMYGRTDGAANWNVAQWDVPEDLTQFDKAGVAQNRFSRVVWYANGHYELAQNSDLVPCVKRFPSGRSLVNEVDLVVAPNNANYPDYPQAVGSNKEQLSDLAQVDASITLQVKQANAIDIACNVSATTFTYAVVLTNTSAHEIVFYQLRLAQFTLDANGIREGAAKPGWFFTGNNSQSGAAGQWGFGDNITSLGQPWAMIGKAQTYHVDLLPRLVWLLHQGGPLGLDQNLSHWRLTGTYHGQNTMGHMVNDAVWSGFSLTASLLKPG